MSERSRVQAAVSAQRMHLLCRHYAAVYLNQFEASDEGGGESRLDYCWVLGVLNDGQPEAIGLWAHDAAARKSPGHVLQNIKSRGVERVRFVIGSGAPTFGQDVRASFPGAIALPSYAQELERSLARLAPNDREPGARQLRQAIGAISSQEAREGLERLESSPIGERYPDVVTAWRLTLEQGRPLFDAPPPLRRVVHSGDGLSTALNRSLGRAIARRRPFTSADDAVAFIRAALERRLRAIGVSDRGAVTARIRTRTALASTMSASL